MPDSDTITIVFGLLSVGFLLLQTMVSGMAPDKTPRWLPSALLASSLAFFFAAAFVLLRKTILGYELAIPLAYLVSVTFLIRPVRELFLDFFWTGGKKAEDECLLAFVFPHECNHPSKRSLFKRSETYLPQGHPCPEWISSHKFFLGVENRSPIKTLRNVMVFVEVVSSGGTWPTNMRLKSEVSGTDKVDIPPLKTEFFLLGLAIDNTRFVGDSIIATKDQYDQILLEKESLDKLGVGLTLLAMPKNFPVLKNNGNKIQIRAYADDCPPRDATITINARDAIEVLLDPNR